MPLRFLSLQLFLMLSTLTLAQPLLYVVQPGDTLTSIAQSFGVVAAELAATNNLADPNRLAVGQQLQVPSIQAWTEPLPAPFKSVSLSPQAATQGRVQILTITLERPGVLAEVSYLGHLVPVLNTEDGSEALLPTPVLQDAESYSLLLRAESGDQNVNLALPVTVLDGGYDREQITLSAETSQLLATEIVNREHALLKNTCATFERRKRWQGAFRYPVERPEFTSLFGTLRSYNGGPYSGFHRGQDFRGEVGTPVYAAADGIVSLSDALELYGNTVILNHGMGVCSAYMHLSERFVMKSQEVNVGDLLGYIGATGLVTGPHLHWEIRVGCRWRPCSGRVTIGRTFKITSVNGYAHSITPYHNHLATEHLMPRSDENLGAGQDKGAQKYGGNTSGLFDSTKSPQEA